MKPNKSVRTMLTSTHRDAFFTDSQTTQNTAAHAQVFCIRALPIAPTFSLQLESEYTFIFWLSLVIFLSFVSLFLKALLVKARSGVLNTKFWFSRNHLSTRVSNYWAFHPQFKNPRDALANIHSTGVQTIVP